MDIEFEKEMNHNKKAIKQVVEENDNNVKQSRTKFQKIQKDKNLYFLEEKT